MPELTERFRKDRLFYLAACIPPEQCLVVDDGIEGIRGAKSAGMRTVRLSRNGTPSQSPADHFLKGDLRGLLDYLNIKSG